MMMPSIFGENLFDDFMNDFSFPTFPNVDKELYGKHAKNLMKTDVKETENAYEIDIDLPGFKKDEVTAKLENGRGVYSFCMCPGGYVVNASSEEGRLAVNGMSYHARAGENANSAIIVTVTPEDYGSEHPLAGMEFQRKLEERAFRAGGGKIPVQRLEDFCKNQISTSFGNVEPQMKGAYAFGDVRGIFPQVLAESIEEGMRQFEHKITGFSDGDTLLSGVESRTSSPVKIPRDENMESEIKGIFPCGEGAGFAGGITSAAMDGMKVAEAVLKKYNKIES